MFARKRSAGVMGLRTPSNAAGRRVKLAAGCLALAMLASFPAAAQAAPPANDDFAAAQVVQLPSHETGTTVDATLEPGEVDPTGDGEGRSVWYELTPVASGPVKVESCGSAFASVVDVYSGSALATLTPLADSLAACAGGGRAYFTALAGTTYHIAVTGYYDQVGALSLTISVPQPPANDDFASAQALAIPQTVTASNVDATAEAGEPRPQSSDDGHSVWYSVTTSAAQPVRIDTCGSEIDTVLGVYTGDAVGGLTEVSTDDDGCDDANGGSLIDFTSVAGTTYHVLVRGYSDVAGNFTLHTSGTAPAPPPPVTPPAPTCPPAGSPPGAVVYRGTHSGGGAVCLTVLANFSAVSSFHVLDAPGDTCAFGFAIDSFSPVLAIQNRAFATATDGLSGVFDGARGAHGTIRLSRVVDGATCTSPVLTWAATTDATPPWAVTPPAPAPDRTPPVVRLRGATIQRPLTRNGVVVDVQCPAEACAVSASATVAGAKIKAASRNQRAGSNRPLRLALSAKARHALRSALKRHRSVRTTVAVLCRDGAGNRTTARRKITLKR